MVGVRVTIQGVVLRHGRNISLPVLPCTVHKSKIPVVLVSTPSIPYTPAIPYIPYKGHLISLKRGLSQRGLTPNPLAHTHIGVVVCHGELSHEIDASFHVDGDSASGPRSHLNPIVAVSRKGGVLFESQASLRVTKRLCSLHFQSF